LTESAFRTKEAARARKPNGNGARAARGEEKRDRILRAAVRVFAKKGFHGARVADGL